ncbi:MAG: hypothetical protein GXP15_16555 [Gammaproteobacteria bacterium]|nr:hypothetical protein [Gammaproteobacteria bacterium]
MHNDASLNHARILQVLFVRTLSRDAIDQVVDDYVIVSGQHCLPWITRRIIS